VRSLLTLTMVVACASVLSACSGTSQQLASASGGLNDIASVFDPKWAAQKNYERALADYQSCYSANPKNVDACEHQRQIMEADVNLLIAALGTGR
jgi:hypothetical protein